MHSRVVEEVAADVVARENPPASLPRPRTRCAAAGGPAWIGAARPSLARLLLSGKGALAVSARPGCCFAWRVSHKPGSVRRVEDDSGMAQNFIACDREQELLLPPSLREWLPEEHLAWFVLDAVGEMDLAAFYACLSRRRAGSGGARSGDDGGAVALRVRDRGAVVAARSSGAAARTSRFG